MDNMSIFDILITACGLYLVYTAVVMKIKGKIVKGVLVSKDVDVEKIKDKEGFIRYMSGKALLVGVLAAAVGMINLVNSYLKGPGWISIAVIAGYFVVLMVFAYSSVKARKIYIE